MWPWWLFQLFWVNVKGHLDRGLAFGHLLSTASVRSRQIYLLPPTLYCVEPQECLLCSSWYWNFWVVWSKCLVLSTWSVPVFFHGLPFYSSIWTWSTNLRHSRVVVVVVITACSWWRPVTEVAPLPHSSPIHPQVFDWRSKSVWISFLLPQAEHPTQPLETRLFGCSCSRDLGISLHI